MDCPQCGGFCSRLDDACSCGYEFRDESAPAEASAGVEGEVAEPAQPKAHKKKKKRKPGVIGENAQPLRANKAIAGKPCAVCGEVLALGVQAATCNDCGAPHHARCYIDHGGCGTKDCVNEPLQRLEGEVRRLKAEASGPAFEGMSICPHCECLVGSEDSLCSNCNAVLSPDGLYHGPKTTAPGAQAALICGLVGLVICGPIFGYLAIKNAKKANEHIARTPRYDGAGMATAGYVLGIIDIVLFFVWMVLRVSNAGADRY